MQINGDSQLDWNELSGKDDSLNSFLDDTEDGVSSEEKNSILSQIDEVLVRKTGADWNRQFNYTAEKNGALFPFLINIIILICTAAVIFALFQLFNRQEDSIINSGNSGLSAEAALLREFREESQKEISLKEEEIAEIRSQMGELAAERENLAARNRQILREKEAVLEKELERLLNQEREKLDARGMDPLERDRILDELEQRLSEEHAMELSALKERTEDQLKEREQEIERLVAGYEQKLGEIQSKQEAGAQNLAELQDQNKRAEMIIQQLSAGYLRTLQLVDSSDYPAARSSAENIREILDKYDFKSLPQLARREQTDRKLVDSLEKLISYEELKEKEISTSVQVRGGSTEAEAELKNEIGRQRETIEELNRELAAKESDLQSLSRRMNQTGNSLDSANRELASIKLKNEERLNYSRRIEMIEDKLGSLQTPDQSVDRRKSVLSSVNTKLEIREILISPEVSTAYPEAEESFDEYLDALQGEYTSEGYREALEDIVSMLDSILSPGAAGDYSLSRQG